MGAGSEWKPKWQSRRPVPMLHPIFLCLGDDQRSSANELFV